LATLIGLMMWFYLTAYAVLLGAEFNAALDHEWRMAAKRQAERTTAEAPRTLEPETRTPVRNVNEAH
jgi:uncharacterized BrkB/YihY/UPF0761 family membrane protein